MMSESVIAGAPESIECDLGEGLVILNSRTNVYFRLNAVGKVVWRLVADPPAGQAVTLDQLVSGVVDRYDVDAERCRADVQALLEKMEESGLIRVTG
jgi:hypothetical protein